MIADKIMNKLGEMADRKVNEIACIGWVHAPKPPKEMLKPKE